MIIGNRISTGFAFDECVGVSLFFTKTWFDVSILGFYLQVHYGRVNAKL